MLCEFLTMNNLIVRTTQVQHQTIHKETWKSPDYEIVNQINHVFEIRGDRQA